ncbi:MAG: DUF494 family protein [Candidatus Eisenbacteria bacterium]|nr:DUF494 family protein [Candidatus Eisenbacteria bacterium]
MSQDPVREILELITQQFRSFIEGDGLALEELTDLLTSRDYEPEDLRAAFELIVQLLEPVAEENFQTVGAGGSRNRVLNHWERSNLTPQAYGYLLQLKQNGSLDDDHMELILERAGASGARRMDVRDVEDLASWVLFGMETEDGGPDQERSRLH